MNDRALITDDHSSFSPLARQLLQRGKPLRTVCSMGGTPTRNCPAQRTGSPSPSNHTPSAANTSLA